ncbi:MAG TPA: protein kinase, partial [Pyrinomonadaceae bacterium]|nr:protein kinase [Pyrinomonadaceae bacterium]
SLPAGTILQARYRIVRQLGRGGMGAVYEAVDDRLGITVALKETLSSEASMRKQFEHEARLLASMQHPALPRVSDHFVEGQRAFLVMQFIGGVDLAKIIAQQPGPFPRDQVIAWADQLLDALIYLHSHDRQVIHRDIKPHNLKLTATGQIALLDFGLARAQPTEESLTASRAFFGYTKHYAPLEQIQDQRTDPRSDIYALGATLYHLLTGIKPPDAMVRATALINSDPDPLKPADQIHPAVGPQIATILCKAMAQRSEDRFASASEFREALRRMGRAKESSTEEITSIKTKAAEARTRDNDYRAVMKMPMVASATRFGPGAMTAVFIIVAALAAGLWHVSQHWSKAPSQTPGLSTAAPIERQTVASRKVEKSRTADNAAVTPLKPREQSESKKANETEKKPVSNPRASPSPRNLRRSIAPRENRRRPNAPSIRLPRPEVAETYRLTSFNVGYRNAGRYNPAPRFYRASDGTRIVKFPDGSSRVIRPGQKSGY